MIGADEVDARDPAAVQKRFGTSSASPSRAAPDGRCVDDDERALGAVRAEHDVQQAVDDNDLLPRRQGLQGRAPSIACIKITTVRWARDGRRRPAHSARISSPSTSAAGRAAWATSWRRHPACSFASGAPCRVVRSRALPHGRRMRCAWTMTLLLSLAWPRQHRAARRSPGRRRRGGGSGGTRRRRRADAGRPVGSACDSAMSASRLRRHDSPVHAAVPDGRVCSTATARCPRTTAMAAGRAWASRPSSCASSACATGADCRS